MKPRVFLISFLILFSCQKEEFETIGYIKDIEGNSYETVIIGDQIWMTENLRTTKYNDGSPIEYVKDWNIEKGRYCWYDHDEKNKKPHGALYNWYAVKTDKLAPEGWRIPTWEDWDILRTTLGGHILAGGKIKKRGNEIWEEPNKLVDPDCGFNAYPSGHFDNILDYKFKSLGIITFWWTSTIYDPRRTWHFVIKNDNTGMWEGAEQWNFFISVRCIKE